MNEGQTFDSTIQEVGQNSVLPTSQGTFEQAPAVASLDAMREAGQQAIDAQGVANVAQRELEAVQDISPEVREASNRALQATVDSLQKQSDASKKRSGFWGGVRNILGKNPAIKDAERANRQLDAGVGIIRTTGAIGRSMDEGNRNFTERQRSTELARLENASSERRLSLRERIFNFTNEKALKAMAKHSQLEGSINAIRGQLDVIKSAVDSSLQEGIDPRVQIAQQAQEALQGTQDQFAQATQNAQQRNYTGYTQGAV